MKPIIALNQENLTKLPSEVKVPTYNRDRVKTSIVHIGVGNFHRSHEAYYTNKLMEEYDELDCGICGIGLLEYDKKIYEVLKSQDYLYTLVVKELDGKLKAEVIGSIIDFIYAPTNPTLAIEKMADGDIKIISLTITEGGYNLKESTGEFDLKNPAIIKDIQNPLKPETVFGYLTQALKLRMNRGVGGVTIQSCDNIQGNGNVAKKSLLKYVEQAEPELLSWIEKNVSFPNAMVDRITPVTVEKDIQKLQEEFNINDQWPVVCEPFIQWVVEDKFANGRPAWEKVGAQYVENVVPYENMKLRLLNAGHSVLGMLGAIHGFDTIDEAARDEDFKIFLRGFMDKEATPTLGDLGGVDLNKYKDNLIERFQNVYIKDLISRICLESSAKIPIFLLPTINYQLAHDGDFQRGAFVVAAWCRYNDGIDEKGNSYKIVDVMSDELKSSAVLSHTDPIKFLEIEPIFGDLKDNKKFVDTYIKYLQMIRDNKIKSCVQKLNENLN